MYDPTFISHVTMALHEDRVSALRRTRHDGLRVPSNLVSRSVVLYQSLMHRQNTPCRVEHHNWSLN